MIWGCWAEPNRHVRAKDPDDHTMREWITSAPTDSDEALRARLERQGYSDVEIKLYDFQAWKRRAEKAGQKVAAKITAYQKPTFNEGLYREIKQHLFDLSNGRCAYCEAMVKHVDHGDVEHYRPKKSVREDPAHSGYYWLAYAPANLLPSCGLCNQAPHKQDQFPVENGTRIRDPLSPLESERPLLFNPYLEDPLEHLQFLSTGHVKGKTQRGKKTIEICGLQRLRNDRQKAMETLANKLRIRMVAEGSFEAAVGILLEDLKTGQDEYCNALFDYLLYLVKEERKSAARAEKSVLAALRQDVVGDPVPLQNS